MAVKFNPFTGQLQIDEKGSGGGSSYIDGEVATYADLPLDGTAALNSAWLVRTASGVWPVSRKQAGIYIRTATGGSSRDADYTYAGTMPDVFSDSVFLLYDEASTTRTGQFNLGSITAGQNRVLTWPDGNGTIARTETFAAPPAIGNTTPSTGAFTTLSSNVGTITASTPLAVTQTWNNSAVQFVALQTNITNTASQTESYHLFCTVGGSTVAYIRRDGRIVAGANVYGSTGLESALLPQGVAVGNASYIGFCSNSFANDSGGDLRLFRDAANVLAQRNAANAQTFRIYSTFSSTTSFERLNLIAQTGGSFIIGTEKGSAGGTARGLELRTDNTARLTIGSSGGVTLADAQDVAVGTTTGTKIGTATTQKIGFFNATPVVQQAAVADATDAASTQARLNDLLARVRTLGLIAT